MDALRSVLRDEDSQWNLDVCALEIAQIEDPGLNVGVWLKDLDLHAAGLRRHEHFERFGFRVAAQRYLFKEWGFGGNEEDYYNPRNSCLHHVLQERRGIPITLCVLYMELGRRLGVQVDGIAAPGHFLVRLEEDGDDYYVDPYRGGVIREDVEGEFDPRFLEAASRRTICVRMLNNLRLIYLQRQNWAKARQVLDLLLEADGDDADALRQRAATLAATQKFGAAAQDLRRYLELRPFDADKNELEGQIGRLMRMQAHKN
jgi:regulator of sirC expression with transglutaminase-like and TPR domain